MSTIASSFYITGGTLPPGTPSYVERQADRDLYEALLRGEFCYVLHARQMGKSSLMAHVSARLRQAGIAVVNLDLTRLGQNLSVEQWYDGLLGHLGRQLDLEDELEEYWLDHERLSPLQCWLGALHDVVLAHVPGPLVIFIDEIDAVRSLAFSTDEFFAAIRDCYNRRSQDPEFGRLAFCLLGVATPSDLIQDTRTTPFNIGTRIELTDFTEPEAAPLAAGLVGAGGSRSAPARARARARARNTLDYEQEHEQEHEQERSASAETLLRRILYWTGGHPYLTQRLCQAVANTGAEPGNPKSKIQNPKSEVDRLCERLFLSPQAQERDNNLLFVRERLLNSDADPAGLLDLYSQVRRGRRVPDDELDSFVGSLRLAGIVRSVDGRLQVRNRIYERVFDPAWVTAHMPGAELRRQREAYRRGLWRAAGVSTAILAVVGGLALTAVQQARRAGHVARREAYQRHLAQDGQRALREGQRVLRRLLYVAQVKVAQQTEEDGDVARAQALLETLRPEPGQEDLRGWEWRYLWRRCQGDARATWRGNGVISEVKFSPDGRLLAVANDSIDLRDAATGRVIASLAGPKGGVWSIAFSPDGKLLASVGGDALVHLWDIASRKQIAAMAGHKDKMLIHAVQFSTDGKLLASDSWDNTVRLWDVARRRQIAVLAGGTSPWHSLAFSPDGKLLATGIPSGAVRLWSIAARRPIALLAGHAGDILSLAFSPDGRTLATGSYDSTVKLWDVAHRREIATLTGHQGEIGAVTFSPDGKRLATGCADDTIKLWDLSTRQEIATLRGHSQKVHTLAFSPDGQVLASGSTDATIRLWNPAAIPALRQKAPVNALAFTPDGTALATANGDGTLKLWDVSSGRPLVSLKAHKSGCGSLAFSPDQRLLATGGDDGIARLWAVGHGSTGSAASASLRPVTTFSGFQGGLWDLAFSPDGKSLAMKGTQSVKLWDLATKRVMTNFMGERKGWWGLAFSPDGATLASESPDGMRLWDLATRRKVATLSGASGPDPPVFSPPDGKTLATSGSFSGTVKLWDLSTRRAVATLQRQTPGSPIARDIAFSPDGKTVAIPSANNVLLWNLTTHQEVAVLKGHQGTVIALAFSPDGNILASGGMDGTVRLWHAATWQEADPLRIVMNGASDQTVQLQWRPVPSALGYSVYRGPGVQAFRRSGVQAGKVKDEPALVDPERPNARTPERLNARTPERLNGFVRLATLPPTVAAFTDRGPPLVNGRPQTYAVAALFPGAGGRTTEGPPVTLQLTPVAAPPGWMGTSVNEGLHTGSVSFDALADLLTLRGSGNDTWDTADGFYFLNQPVTADFQITVRALTRPTAANEWAKAGLMVRDSLAAGARNGHLVVTPRHGVQWQWRPSSDDETLDANAEVISHARLRLPITLRLTRQGDTITAAYSRDDGRHFQPVSTPLTFDEPLPRTLYAGLCITAHNASRVTEAKFRGLGLQRR